jgi:nucleoside-diphosphate-sugar epimerase
MPTTVFLAGAAGAIGRRLVPLLRDSGYRVFGTTRSAERAAELKAAEAEPVVVNVFDASILAGAVGRIRPEVVIHQLTDLPSGLDPSRMEEGVRRNARVRIEGTRNLVEAALAGGARRFVAQSIAWAYAPGPRPFAEDAPLDLKAEGLRGVSIGGVVALERLTLGSPPLVGTVLRYGRLYGPGTGVEAPPADTPVHVDAAAHAALLAVERSAAGVFNVAEDTGAVSIEKARRELGWDPGFRLPRAAA